MKLLKKRSLRWITLGLALLMLTGVSGCASKSASRDTAYAGTAAGSVAYSKNAPMEAPVYADADYAEEAYYNGYEMEYMPAAAAAPGAVMSGEGSSARAESFDKIIYSGSANVETLHFDEAVEKVYALIEEYGGFLESSYVSGRDYYSTYYNRDNYRSASFTIRVPRESFQSFTGALETLGNLTNSSVQAQNITSSYFDTESRLSTYRTEEERLLEMLSRAETVEDMLNIEDRLANVRYNIESLTTTLTNWDSKVNYSTVDLYISEVKELTPETPITRTFGEELGQRFRESCDWALRALKDLVLFLWGAVPVLVPLAVLLLVLILIIRAKRRKKREKKAVELDR